MCCVVDKVVVIDLIVAGIGERDSTHIIRETIVCQHVVTAIAEQNSSWEKTIPGAIPYQGIPLQSVPIAEIVDLDSNAITRGNVVFQDVVSGPEEIDSIAIIQGAVACQHVKSSTGEKDPKAIIQDAVAYQPVIVTENVNLGDEITVKIVKTTKHDLRAEII